jgi:hypothetical protein
MPRYSFLNVAFNTNGIVSSRIAPSIIPLYIIEYVKRICIYIENKNAQRLL